jgi:uncharacterized protein YutE (UPF0331/DUF86 family)
VICLFPAIALLVDTGVYPKAVAKQIARSAGLGSVLVHDDNDVDRRIVHASIKACLQGYRRDLEYVSGFIEQQGR